MPPIFLPVLCSSCRSSCDGIPIEYPFGISDGCGSPQYRHMLDCSGGGGGGGGSEEALFFITPSGNNKVQSIDYDTEALTIFDQAIQPSDGNVFIPMNCSGGSKVVLNMSSICFNISGHSCYELYEGCSSFRVFTDINNDLPPCCFIKYNNVKNNMSELKCSHYTSIYDVGKLTKEEEPVNWPFGMKLSFQNPASSSSPGCDRCRNSGGACGFDVLTLRNTCICNSTFNTTTQCYEIQQHHVEEPAPIPAATMDQDDHIIQEIFGVC
ncbi:OLC1v1036510C2 [Oldenlandia corymbosa var. corymbosa]|nr:OLC1v1036510C2 [Oldenlandia corymbosa var. corymbosa]